MLLEGYKIFAGGKEWIVPEMRTKTARKYLPYITGQKPAPSDRFEMLDLLAETVSEILLPNYPEMTKEMVEETFSPREFRIIIDATNKAAGWFSPGGDQGEGATVPPPSTGAESMPA